MTTVAPSQRSYVFEDRLEKGIELKEVRITCRQSVKRQRRGRIAARVYALFLSGQEANKQLQDDNFLAALTSAFPAPSLSPRTWARYSCVCPATTIRAWKTRPLDPRSVLDVPAT